MPETYKQTYTASFEIGYEDTDTKRSLTVDIIDGSAPTVGLSGVLTRANSFATILTAGALSGTNAIQPTSWRDEDDDEEEYIITSIIPTVTYKQEIRVEP